VVRANTHLNFRGDCEAAFRFYENCLGCRIVTINTYKDSPLAALVGPEWQEKILHATLESAAGVHLVTGSDPPPERYARPQGFATLLSVDDAEEADRIFQSLAEGGTVQMPLQQTFWALRFGMVTDRFGTPWMINCGNPA
jgi:PhnB protein